MTRARRAGIVALAAVALLGAAGCSSQQPTSPRRALAAYIRRVNRIEARGIPSAGTISRISSQLSGRHAPVLSTGPAVAWDRRLAAARRTFSAQTAALRALAAPPRAARLRSMLVSLAAGEVALTDQLRLLVDFLPRFRAAVTPLGPALVQLEHALGARQAPATTAASAGGTTPAATTTAASSAAATTAASSAAATTAASSVKVAALRRFQATADAIARRLRRLSPPPVSRPGFEAQLASLRGMAAAAGRLATSLAGGAPGSVAPLLVAFERAAVATRSRPVQRAQIAAVRAYDRRAQGLVTLSGAIARERLALAASARS